MRNTGEKPKKAVEYHLCGQCANCTPLTEPEKLNIHGDPILGTCPYWTESKCTLLSWCSQCEHFKKKDDDVSATIQATRQSVG